MHNILPEFIIISAHLKAKTEVENALRNVQLKNLLKDLQINHKEVEGYFNNTKENCIFIQLHGDNKYDLEFFVHLACIEFNQECILYRDSNNSMYLKYFKNNKPHSQCIGKGRFINERDIPRNFSALYGAYTHFTLTRTYLVAVNDG